MDIQTKAALIGHYRGLLFKHQSGPAVAQWSPEGQRFRFEKLVEIGDLSGAQVLDLGCNLGDRYPFLKSKFAQVRYTGIDIVSELVLAAAKTHPEARFLCRDVLSEGLEENFDYILMSGLFNNAQSNGTDFLKEMVTFAYAHATKGIAFNFTSTIVNRIDPEMHYHDPIEVLGFCLDRLSARVSLHHHYERCDVAIFVYRP